MRGLLRTGVIVGVLLLPVGFLLADQGGQRSVTRSPHGSLSLPCENCHTFTSWKPLRNIPEFDHNKTRFPLRALHQGVACAECHVSLIFSNVGTKCADCHADIHKGQLGLKCEECHTVRGWQATLQAVKNHQNRFPLVGAHAALTCDECHKGAAVSQFQGLSTQCIACHTQALAGAIPDHQVAQFPTTCEICHNMDSWLGVAFDHGKFTGFPLTGVHATLDCTACHVNGNFKITATNCVGCHLKDFTGAQNPNHVQAGFPQDCAICHSTANWTGVTFNHSQFTSFPLTGAHVNVPCSQCHLNGVFAGTPTACASCHMKDFQGTTNPNHVQANFPTACQQCHNTTSWANATFNHSATGFPLTGAHATLQCQQCHVNGNYNLTSANTPCASCHLADFQKTTDPNHVAAGFPTDCSMCHGTANWSGASFNHAATGFALTGAHATLQCQQCHVNNNFSLTSANTACFSCHQTDYQNTNNPSHAAAGFPTDCSVCHNTTSWAGATFNHNNTPFPLTGAHVNVPCTSCHINNVFAGTPTDCYSCHKVDYQGTTNPNHVAAGFPTTCQSCHNTTSWAGAVFNHTWFPVPHHNATLCSDCHVNPSNYTVFLCTNCHTKPQTDAQHTDVRGYVWNSANCYACHPNGRAGN